MFRTALVALSFTAAASAAVAMPSMQATPSPAPAAEATATTVTNDRDPMKVVCRSIRPPTGTRLQSRARERVCQTQEAWETQREEAQNAAHIAMRGDATANDREFVGQPGGVSMSTVGQPK